MENIRILDQYGQPMRASGYSGARSGFGGQLRDWNPRPQTADAALLPTLELGNARADDLVRNNAIASNGVQLHVDNIVGHMFRLSYKPRWRRLGMSEEDARSFAKEVEDAWAEYAEDPVHCYIDAERKRTHTMMVREVIANHTTRAEAMAMAAPWVSQVGTPFRTRIKMISSHRVSNPHQRQNSRRLRGGIELNSDGAAVAYHVRCHSNDADIFGNGMGYTWKRVPRETRWGRQQFIHVFEPCEDGQTRGDNQFLRVMEQMHMLPKLQQTKLQNAIVNAMYAAVIESELDTGAAMEFIGADGGTISDAIMDVMSAAMGYHANSNIKMNGVKIPHLVPGERLNLQTSGNVDNGYVALEESILRWIAAGLNLPFEQLSKNFKGLSYSTLRGSLLESFRFFLGRRKFVAGRFSTIIFANWLEEALIRGTLVAPKSRYSFWDARGAWCNSDWIGSGRIAIDGLKEVKESVLRIESGLSTYEKELALMGEDYAEIFQQQVREMEERRLAGLPPASWAATQVLAPDNQPQESEQVQGAENNLSDR